jgi:hypothetical protein
VPGPERFVPRFAAEPPQEDLPYGRWGEQLRDVFLQACLSLDTEGEDLGEVGDITWYPDRTWHGRTYVPATAPTTNGFELYGYVRFLPPADGQPATELTATADFTGETAAEHPEWTLDLCDEVIGSWRGESGAVAAMTLVWGRPMKPSGAVATAELGGVVVDQCTLAEERFTLIAPDDYRDDLLDIALFDARGGELARESLYGEDEDDEDAS